MNGLELSRKYYETYGEKMLREQFPDLSDLLAVAKTGSGSDACGFDDELSLDHDYEPGFQIFLKDEVPSRRAFELERAYAKLPKEFEGYRKQLILPVGGARNGVFYASEYFREKVGDPEGKLDLFNWLTIPEYVLFEATNGEVFHDPSGFFTKIREDLCSMPRDVLLKRLSACLLTMGQSGQYNYPRLLKRNERGASELAVRRFTEAAMKAVFLLNRSYMPYYKWSFRAMRDLPLLKECSAELEKLLCDGGSEEASGRKARKIEEISTLISIEVHRQGLSKKQENDLEKLAYLVNDEVEDLTLRAGGIPVSE